MAKTTTHTTTTTTFEHPVGNPWGTPAEREANRIWHEEQRAKLTAETNAAMAVYRAARAKRIRRAAIASGIHG